jgi:hypothetical protein
MRGSATTFAAPGSSTGTPITEIFSCKGLSPASGPRTGPHVGPGRSGYDDTYNKS